MAGTQARHQGLTELSSNGVLSNAELRTRRTPSTQPQPLSIDSIGNVPLKYIDPLTHLAFPSKGALAPENRLQAPMDRPFAGLITVKGRLPNAAVSGRLYYQLQYAPAGSNAWLPASQPATSGQPRPQTYLPLGCSRRENKILSLDCGLARRRNQASHASARSQDNKVLAVWDTESLNGTYDIRLAYSVDNTTLNTAHTFYSEIVTIVVHNDGFSSSLGADPAINPACDLDLMIRGRQGHTQNTTARVQGDVILGRLRARSHHFWKWTLRLEPSDLLRGRETNLLCCTYGSLTDKGPQDCLWRLHPLANGERLAPGRYALTLHAYDRAIVNSNPTLVHQGHKSVRFCVAATA